jgi:hypothetical protein
MFISVAFIWTRLYNFLPHNATFHLFQLALVCVVLTGDSKRRHRAFHGAPLENPEIGNF